VLLYIMLLSSDTVMYTALIFPSSGVPTVEVPYFQTISCTFVKDLISVTDIKMWAKSIFLS